MSVIIPTFNRAMLLGETLEKLADVCGPCPNVEVIVVDNNSTDSTWSVIESFSKQFAWIKGVEERNQGISYARNRAIEMAQGNILVFIDDDVEVGEGWLHAMTEAFLDPDVWGVGGRVLPAASDTVPSWLPTKLSFVLSLLDLGDTERIMSGREKPLGANMAFRRAAFEDVGGFDPRLGRRGDVLSGGEEVLLCYKLRGLGKKIIYKPNALVYHKIGPKMNKDYVLRSAYWLGVSEAYIESTHCRWKFALKCVAALLYPFVIYPCRSLFGRCNLMRESTDLLSDYLVRYFAGYLRMWVRI